MKASVQYCMGVVECVASGGDSVIQNPFTVGTEEYKEFNQGWYDVYMAMFSELSLGIKAGFT